MGVKELVNNIKEKIKNANTPRETLTDDETRDKYLRSLRRERRTQLEQLEKEKLKKQIETFKHDFTKKEMFGVSQNMPARQHQAYKTLLQKEAIKEKKKLIKHLVKKKLSEQRASIQPNTLLHGGLLENTKPKQNKARWL